MKKRILLPGLLTAVLTLGLAPAGIGTLSVATAEPEPGQPIKIMLGGDSITQGFDGDYTWRYRLDRELRRQGVSFNFVGPRMFTYGGANHYQVPSGWDTDHAATGGTRLRTQMSEIVTDMANHEPDVLVALYGTTDLLPRSANDPNPTVPLNEEIADLRTYIQEARDVNSDVDIILGEITTRRIPNRQKFNDAVNALAKSEDRRAQYTKSRVVVADLDYPGWDPAKNTYDTTHPTPGGEAIIAQRIGWALKSFNVLTQSPAIKAAGLVWAPPWAPKFRVSVTRRIVTDWSTTKFLNKPQMLRVWIKDLRTKKAKLSAWSTAPSHVSSVKKPGKYQVRVQGRRQAMISPWSKTWTITVKR